MTDISIQDHGSIVMFVPLTEGGTEFLTTEVQTEAWQWMGHSLAVDHRMAGGLIEACQDNGLEVRF
jgi:hypothetical protein